MTLPRALMASVLKASDLHAKTTNVSVFKEPTSENSFCVTQKKIKVKLNCHKMRANEKTHHENQIR